MSDWGFDIARAETSQNVEDSRMHTMNAPTVGMFCQLPLGTEVWTVHIAPFGLSVQCTNLFITAENRQATREWANGDENAAMPFQIAFYLPPEDADTASEVDEAWDPYTWGFRDGRDGAPQRTPSMLGAGAWNDPVCVRYLDGYKSGLNSRKKGH